MNFVAGLGRQLQAYCLYGKVRYKSKCTRSADQHQHQPPPLKMDSRSQETLRRIQENDDTLTELEIGGNYYNGDSSNGGFNSSSGNDFSTLGTYIRENTHLTKLHIGLSNVALDGANNEFYEGLKRNTSIQRLSLNCRNLDVVSRIVQTSSGIVYQILKAYQENNNLSLLSITRADLQNGGENVIATTLRRCTNLTDIDLYGCNITDGQLLPIVEAVRGHRSLKILDLNNNRIGNAGCETIATLIRDHNSNINHVDLGNNDINIEGASILANGLENNTKMKILYLDGNPIDQSSADIFNKLLCNTSSINLIHLSNHTLANFRLPFPSEQNLDLLLKLNKCTNKSHVAIKKILKYHPNIDMEPFFEWNTEGEGERDLKALPYIVAWFERAGEAAASDEGGEGYNIDAKKLSAIYQFARAMPLLFVPASHIKGDSTKRKRSDA